MKKVYSFPKSLTKKEFTYCPGCAHGILHKLIATVMDELGIREKTIGVASVGCSVFAYEFFNCDMSQAAHGRAPAVATGIKRSLPNNIVFTYQGDGDMAAIGTAEIVHAANRGENITVFFFNNAIYGMTGGQMAPTTLEGMKTTTSPYGRCPEKEGYPIKMSEMLSTLYGVAYIERVSLTKPINILKAKQAIKKAFTLQQKKKGFTMIEVLAFCATNMKLKPIEAVEYVEMYMEKEYPLGIYKDISHE